MISIIKRNNVKKVLEITRLCRDIMGANGILDESAVMRHMVNVETFNIYGGTEDIHALILGKSITGISAFDKKS